MNFENPVWLYLTPLIVLSIAGLIALGLRSREALLSQFAASRLLNELTEKVSLKRTLLKAGFVLLACALIGVALARPQYGVNYIERKARGLNIVFVLDSSKSMLATDLRPSRLERAKLAIIDLVERLESDHIGLVVFAGTAFLQTPPTLDYSNFLENLDAVDPSSLSRGGSNIGQALREAVKAFPEDNNFKVVVLLTDGEDLAEEAVDTAREVAQDGIKVYSIGIGTPEGSYLKIRSENGVEEFLRDSNGQPVRSRLDETTLQKISQLSGGSYSKLAGQSLETLYTSVIATLPREERESELQETHIERYQWVLLAAVICLILENLLRRRKTIPASAITMLALLSLLTPTPSDAQEVTRELSDESIEETPSGKLPSDPRMIYNQAHQYLTEGDYSEAMDLYKTAIQQSNDIALERNGLYNMAHASNQLGEEALQAQEFETAIEQWKQAEALFKSANELDPTDTASLEDAQKMADRREALETFLEHQKSQDQQQQQNNDSNSDQNQQNSETDSNQNEPDKSNSQPNEDSGQQEPPEKQENTPDSESPGSEDAPSEESKQTQNPSSESSEDNDSKDSSRSPEESSEDNDSEDSRRSPEESTGNPENDTQQDEETMSGGENEPVSDAENNEGMQETSDMTQGYGETEKTPTELENADLAEARLLLESLRNSERLLPFEEHSDDRRKNGDKRDW